MATSFWVLLLATGCGKDEPTGPKVIVHGLDASSGGRATTNCSGCHADATGAVLTITGPQTVSPGATNQYTATITGGPAVVGGTDIHVTGGTLASLTGQGTKLLNSDIVHSSPKPFASGSVSWNFNWTAPTTPGTVQMSGAGNSANGDGSDAGDAGDGAATRTITVQAVQPANQPPVAKAGADQTVNDADGSGSEQVTLDGSASTDDGTITSYAWTEGGSAIATGQKPAVTLAVGQHTITLTVTDNGSPALTATDVVVVTVTPKAAATEPPVANAGGPYQGTMGVPVQLDGRGSSAPAGSIVAYQWDFGDGQLGSGPTPKHRYACPGSFTVGLVVTDNLGATGSDITEVLVSSRANGAGNHASTEDHIAGRNRCQNVLGKD